MWRTLTRRFTRTLWRFGDVFAMKAAHGQGISGPLWHTGPMRKLPAWTHHIVLPFFLTMVMTFIVSGISTVHALGFHGILPIWLGAWLASWAIAFPSLIVILPFVRRWTALIVEEHNA